MEFPLSRKQKEFQTYARDCIDRNVQPVVADFDCDPDPTNCIPTEIVEENSRFGLRTLVLSPGRWITRRSTIRSCRV